LTDWSSDLALAMHLADVADPISMRHFRRGPAARTKADGTIVTEADEAVERALRRELASARPDDDVLGEEQGGGRAATHRRWILDPIDGTNNYSWGIPIWGTLIALEEDGALVVGVVSAPALGERYDAARDAGARRNGEPMHVSGVSELKDARVSYGSVESFALHGHMDGFRRLISSARASRGLGDFWGHMLVAAGHIEVMVEPRVNVWDLAPLLVIVEEAGGRLTDIAGSRRVDGGSVLTTNGLLHPAALDCFST
jgi:histidinol-phosphatase